MSVPKTTNFPLMRKKFMFRQPLRRRRRRKKKLKNLKIARLSNLMNNIWNIMLRLIGNRSSTKNTKTQSFQSIWNSVESKSNLALLGLHRTDYIRLLRSFALIVIKSDIFLLQSFESIKTCIEIDNGFPFKNLNRD